METRVIKFRAYIANTMTYIGLQDFKDWDMETLIEEKTQFMQFTGLTDKNGVEIYEGDILHFVTYNGGGFQQIGLGVYYVVEYRDFYAREDVLYRYIGFVAVNANHPDNISSITYQTMSHGATVIGNIHEHAHLLK